MFSEQKPPILCMGKKHSILLASVVNLTHLGKGSFNLQIFSIKLAFSNVCKAFS